MTGPLTVKVTTKVPWVAFPSYLASGRVGMMAQAQLDDTKTCDRKLVGTGPFVLSENNPNARMVLSRNPNFRGEAYPSEGDPGDAERGAAS